MEGLKIEVVKIDGVVDNHTARRIAPVVPTPDFPNKGDIVTYVRGNKVKKVGEGEDDYVIEEVVVEESRVNRQAFIAKDASEVGIMNILEKVRRSGDKTLYDQTHSPILPGIQDYTKAPHSVGEALTALQKGSKSFEGLQTIFGNKSFEDLALMSADEISQYVSQYQAAHTTKTEGENK